MTAPSSADSLASPGPLPLSGPLDIHAAPAWRDQLLAQLQTSSVVLDLSGVTACDLAGLQVLCAARATALARGRTFVVSAPSAAVDEACTALGLAPAALSTP